MKRAGGVILGVAALIFAASALTFGNTFVGAIRVEDSAAVPDAAALEGEDVPRSVGSPGEPVESRGAPTESPGAAVDPPMTASLAGIVYPRTTEDEILDAVNHDPFQPDRTPMPERYVLPSNRAEPAAGNQDDRRRRGPEIRVVGAAIVGDNLALAMIQVDDSIPLALLLGETVEGYTLAAVDTEGATLVREDETLTLPVVEPAYPREANPRSTRGRAQNNASDMQALQTRVQEMIRNLQQQQRGQVQRGGGQATIMLRPGGGVQLIQGGGTDRPLVNPMIVRPRGGGGGGRIP
jgi:hypothetical protein